MAGGSYKPNNKGFQDCALGPEIRKSLLAIAENGKNYAESISQDFRQTGDYADSFQIVEASVDIHANDRAIKFRAAARLENTSEHAAAVEFGNRGREAHHVLARTGAWLESTK